MPEDYIFTFVWHKFCFEQGQMACRVCLDGEDVQFDGETPQQVQNVLFFLEDFLKQQHKQISKVFLEDKPLSFSDFETPIDSFKTITCESQDTNSTKISEALVNFRQNTDSAPEILTRDTEQIFQFAQNFVQELLTILNILENECYLLSIIHEPLYLQWIQAFTQTLEDKDFGLTYDVIANSLVPLLEETQKQCL